mmetsp:Transcript_103837/g.180403  ORF Transcript_103837/g.180403 Transcript_103837/m.180403 type:complete len:131 (+) Transcript_103837:78-470(+)
MWTARCARFAQCRASNVAWFTNASIQGRRTLAAAALCCEMRPMQGFAEQRVGIPGTAIHLQIGEALDDVNGAASRQAIAALLESIAALSGTAGSSVSEVFDICMALGCLTRTCQSVSSATSPILHERGGI